VILKYNIMECIYYLIILHFTGWFISYFISSSSVNIFKIKFYLETTRSRILRSSIYSQDKYTLNMVESFWTSDSSSRRDSD